VCQPLFRYRVMRQVDLCERVKLGEMARVEVLLMEHWLMFSLRTSVDCGVAF
jgi:hypothetical protein